MAGKLLTNAQKLLPEENIRYVFTGHTGVRESIIMSLLFEWWDLLQVVNKPRIIAVTDSSIVVMRVGRLRWQRSTAKKVLYKLPRKETRLVPVNGLKGRQTRLPLGNERIWVGHKAYPYIVAAEKETNSQPIP